MTKFLARIAVVLWFVFGFVGLGVLVGHCWLDRALSETHGGRPPVTFLAISGQRAPCTIPASMDAMHRELRAEVIGDLRTYVHERMRCANTAEEHEAFVTMLRAAAATGDTIAVRALDIIVRSSCETLIAVSTGAASTSASVETCVELAMYSSVAPNDDAETRERMLRIAQQRALIEAGVATETVTAQFCADIGILPSAAYDQYAGIDPTLASIVAQTCESGARANDAGTETE